MVVMGKEKRDREKIVEMLRRGKSPEDIADFCGYPIELVKQVEESLFSSSGRIRSSILSDREYRVCAVNCFSAKGSRSAQLISWRAQA